jgi:palmitoyltransferase ZDHHC9/14/18
VNGYKVVVRYNETCGFYQPPRAHHCSVNDNCIERFDHHCPWVGTTVGRVRNLRLIICHYLVLTDYALLSIGMGTEATPSFATL